MQVDKDLTQMLKKAIEATGYNLWCVELVNSGKHQTLRVYIDSQKGINIDDCEKASRQISALMEVENSPYENYTLEVSSPGVYRPLVEAAHFQSYQGEDIKLRLKHANELNQKNFSGKLLSAKEDSIVLEVDGEQHHIDLTDIAKANLNPDIFKSQSKAK